MRLFGPATWSEEMRKASRQAKHRKGRKRSAWTKAEPTEVSARKAKFRKLGE
jgi:hypothetical protein